MLLNSMRHKLLAVVDQRTVLLAADGGIGCNASVDHISLRRKCHQLWRLLRRTAIVVAVVGVDHRISRVVVSVVIGLVMVVVVVIVAQRLGELAVRLRGIHRRLDHSFATYR